MSSGDPPAAEAPADEPLAEPQIEAEPGEPEVDDVPAQPKAFGSVKWFSVTKGFGFIQPDEGEGELFVHQTSILAEGFRSLREGERVEFDKEVAEDGRAKAINVTGPEGAPPQGAPRRVFSAQPYNMPQYVVMAPPAGHFMPGPMPGRGPRPGRIYPARGAYGGRGQLVQYERPPPPGTPGFSSGFQVVVHNIPWSMTWQELKDIFSSTPGVVRADVIVDASGRSRGFGTVRYSTREEANAAAETMNNIDIGGRIVSVRIDRFA